jgi:putative transposase
MHTSAVDQDGEVVDVFLQAQQFVTVHAAVQNLFNLVRHLVRAQHYRDLRVSAFNEWSRAVA